MGGYGSTKGNWRRKWEGGSANAWRRATEMHVCFYEGWCNGEDVKEALKRVEKLVKEVSTLIEV